MAYNNFKLLFQPNNYKPTIFNLQYDFLDPLMLNFNNNLLAIKQSSSMDLCYLHTREQAINKVLQNALNSTMLKGI